MHNWSNAQPHSLAQWFQSASDLLMGSIEEDALHICSSGQEMLRIASSVQFETNDQHIYTYTEAQKSATQICGETCLNGKNLELSFELGHSGEILQTGRQRIPD